MNQRTATVNIILSILAAKGIDFVTGKEGETRAQDIFNAQMKQEAKEALFQGFKNQEIQYRPEFQAKVDDDAELKSYVNGLLNNWLRKAPELNCGQKYVPKNPGSRAGSKHPEVRELRKLYNKVKGTEHESRVKAALDAKIAEVAPTKTISINSDLIPAEFQDLLD